MELILYTIRMYIATYTYKSNRFRIAVLQIVEWKGIYTLIIHLLYRSIL